jgi:hypothetical protein
LLIDMTADKTTRRGADSTRTDQIGKVFVAVGQNVRKCLICEQLFTRRLSCSSSDGDSGMGGEQVLERVWNHIVAFVVVVLLIAAAPAITLAAAVWMASIKRIDLDEIILSAMVGPVLCAFWYMFIATITRLARSKREGVSPRNGFLWAGARLFGGWLLSFASTILTVFMVSLFVRETGIKTALFLGVWAPVIVNLLRHFVRYFTPHAPIASSAASVANDQTPMLGREVA